MPARSRARFVPGSSVLRQPASRARAAGPACAAAAVAASRAWLASGIIPGVSAAQRSMATRALLDLRLLTRPDGAVLAAGPGAGRTPGRGIRAGSRPPSPPPGIPRRRCGSWSSCGGCSPATEPGPPGTGRTAPARSATAGPSSTPWAGCPGRSGPGTPLRARGSPDAAALAGLWPMVTAAADAARRSLARGGPLAGRPRSMDYWEDSVQVTLGTAAALLDRPAGRRRPGAGCATHEPGRRWAAAAARLARPSRGLRRLRLSPAAVRRVGHRCGGHVPRPAVRGPGPGGAAGRGPGRAAHGELPAPNGGVRPGSGWPGTPDVAWTPETAFFALYDAATGQRRPAPDPVLAGRPPHPAG